MVSAEVGAVSAMADRKVGGAGGELVAWPARVRGRELVRPGAAHPGNVRGGSPGSARRGNGWTRTAGRRGATTAATRAFGGSRRSPTTSSRDWIPRSATVLGSVTRSGTVATPGPGRPRPTGPCLARACCCPASTVGSRPLGDRSAQISEQEGQGDDPVADLVRVLVRPARRRCALPCPLTDQRRVEGHRSDARQRHLTGEV